MRNRIIFLTIVALAAIGLQGCDKDTTDGLTRITYYPAITLLGDEPAIVNKGEEYSDVGVYAELNGEDVSGQVEVASNVNTDETGMYSISYKITNADGFSATASRTVIVADATITADISGTYAVTANSYRKILATGVTVEFAARFDIDVTRIAPGVFFVSDFFGGWYDKRADYGPSYAMAGYIQLNVDNSIELLLSHIDGWGDSLDYLEEGSYDPTTDNVHWAATYAGLYTWFTDFEKQ
jgi:hypothetical protein